MYMPFFLSIAYPKGYFDLGERLNSTLKIPRVHIFNDVTVFLSDWRLMSSFENSRIQLMSSFPFEEQEMSSQRGRKKINSHKVTSLRIRVRGESVCLVI